MRDKITWTHKTIAIAIISIVLIIFGWNIIPKEVKVKEEPILYLIILDMILGGLLALKIQKNEKQEGLCKISFSPCFIYSSYKIACQERAGNPPVFLTFLLFR